MLRLLNFLCSFALTGAVSGADAGACSRGGDCALSSDQRLLEGGSKNVRLSHSTAGGIDPQGGVGTDNDEEDESLVQVDWRWRSNGSLGESSSSAACAAMGEQGILKWDDCKSIRWTQGTPVPNSGKISWATKLPGCKVFKVALCSGPYGAGTLSLWDEKEKFIVIPLGRCDTPVGAIHLDGKVYVACFGKWPRPEGTSGLAVVDIASETLEAFYDYSGDAHVHNAYAFTWDGKVEIVVPVLGNPWIDPPLTGSGLVRFDRTSKRFVTEAKSVGLNARSAVQQSDNVFYILTQEPAGQPSQLARLQRRGDGFILVGQTALPQRNGGDGGADVILGKEVDSMFCTDRSDGGGKLYYYTFSKGNFAKVSEFETGSHPRYTTVLASGDVVTCNKDGNSLTYFVGLANTPRAPREVFTVSNVSAPWFFIEF